MKKLWGSAFNKKTLDTVLQFTSGRDVKLTQPADYALLRYDILGSKVHCVMLLQQKIINKKDASLILKGLMQIEKLIKENKFDLDPKKEDVHTNIETWLVDKYGIDSIGKLHTARSRNDQSNLDMRLYLRDIVFVFIDKLILLSYELIKISKKYKDCMMPGFTHHQHAMVTTLEHVLLGYTAMIGRDIKGLVNWFDLYNHNPLGNVVSYGTIFPIDREITTKLLAFDSTEINSMDLITNRWEPESNLAFVMNILMNHVSSLAQMLIIFSMPEFGMIKINDQYSTGSSIMPQKRNPDSLEVIKAKASIAGGYLQSLLNLGKANFIGYNRDSQWTKYLIMDLISECVSVPEIISGVINTMTVNKKQMNYWSHKNFIGATSLLEKITSEYQIPFRKVKMIIEKAIKYSVDKDKVTYVGLKKALKEANILIPITENQLRQWQDPIEIIKTTKSYGGPGTSSTEKSNNILLSEIKVKKEWLNKKINKKKKAYQLLNDLVKKITC